MQAFPRFSVQSNILPSSFQSFPERDLGANLPACRSSNLPACSIDASLISLLDEVFADKTYAEWKKILDKHGIIYGLLQTIGEVASDAQAWMNQCFTTIAHPVAGEMKTITAPGTFHKTPTSPRKAAPELGQHTEEFLLELGYSWEDIVRFKEEGTII